MGFLQQSLGFVDLVLHQIQFCASRHRPAEMTLSLVGNQFPLDRLAGPSDLALVADDGPQSWHVFHCPVQWHRAQPEGDDIPSLESCRWRPGFAASTAAS